MLSDAVIEELSRRAPFTEQLVKLAWPSLGTDAKLQVITAHQAGFSPSTPDWLVDLALDDVPVVQYFALRYAYLRSKPKNGLADQYFPVTDADEARYLKAHNIDNETVKAALEGPSSFQMKQILIGMAQSRRLAFLRNTRRFGFDQFIDWLTAAVKENVPDDDLTACALEYFEKPETKGELAMKKFEFDSGESAYFAGKAMEEGWELLRHAGPMLRAHLFWMLPTEFGMTTMKPEVLASMPDEILLKVVTHHNPTKQMQAVQEIVQKNSERFSAQIVEALHKRLNDDFEYPRLSQEESIDQGRQDRPDSARQTLQVVLQLKQRIDELREELAAVKEVAAAKRGFFG